MQSELIENKTILRTLRKLTALRADSPFRVEITVKPWATKKIAQTNCYNCEVAQIFIGSELVACLVDDNGRIACRIPTRYAGAYHVVTVKQLNARLARLY